MPPGCQSCFFRFCACPAGTLRHPTGHKGTQAIPTETSRLMDFSHIPPDDVAVWFKEAEKVLKDIEHRYHRDLVIPSVNQLRYAGKHLSRIIEGEGDLTDNTRDAVKHCKRSIYDSYELEIVFLTEAFDRFQDDYSHIVISNDILPGYVDIVRRFDDGLDFIGQVQNDSREKYYQNCEGHVAGMREAYKQIKAARHPLNALMAEQRKQTINRLLLLIGTIAGVCSAMIAAAIYFKPPA